MRMWQHATDKNPAYMALNPYAQGKARRDIARASARALEPAVLDMVNELSSDISGEEDYNNIAAKISQIRQEKLDALGIDDPSEVASFNAEFDQIEQNFTAQFNGKIAQLKRDAAMDRYGSQIDDATEQLNHPMFDALIPDAAQKWGDRFTLATESHSVNGLMLRSARNGAAKDAAYDSLIRFHKANDKGLELLDGGALSAAKLSLDDGDVFSLETIDGGIWAKKLRDDMMAISAQKQSRDARAGKEMKNNLLAAARRDMDAANRLPPSKRMDAVENVYELYNTKANRGIAGEDLFSQLTSMENTSNTKINEQINNRHKANVRSPKFNGTWKTRLGDSFSNFAEFMPEADRDLAKGLITGPEHSIITERFNTIDGFSDSTTLNMADQVDVWLDAADQGGDIRESKAMEDFRTAERVFADGKNVTDGQRVRNNQTRMDAEKIIQTYKENPTGIDPETEKPMREAMQLRLSSLLDSHFNAQFGTKAAITEDEKNKKLLEDAKVKAAVEADILTPDILESLPDGQRMFVKLERYSVDRMIKDFPKMNEDDIVWTSKQIQDYIRSTPAEMSPQMFADAAPKIQAIAQVLRNYNERALSQDELLLKEDIEQIKITEKKAFNLLTQIADTEGHMALFSQMSGFEEPNDIAKAFSRSATIRRPRDPVQTKKGVNRLVSKAQYEAATTVAENVAVQMMQEDPIKYGDAATEIREATIALNTALTEVEASQGINDWGGTLFNRAPTEFPLDGRTNYLGKVLRSTGQINNDEWVLSPDGKTVHLLGNQVKALSNLMGAITKPALKYQKGRMDRLGKVTSENARRQEDRQAEAFRSSKRQIGEVLGDGGTATASTDRGTPTASGDAG